MARDSTHDSFGFLLRSYRRAKGLTQEQLAERAGVSVRGIQHLEAGDVTPFAGTLQALENGLDLAVDDRAHLRRAVAGHKAELAPPTARDSLPTHNLPTPATSFIGRQQELVVLRERLRATRLLSLTGPGGIGKSRLALELAAGVAAEFEDGVCFVALAPIVDPSLIGQAIAQALGLHQAATRPLSRDLQDHLRDKSLLLVLDNFEHLVSGAPFVSDLLTTCPRLRIVITSRSVLHLSGEHEHAVPPLELPEPSALLWPDRIVDCEAVRLFVERAQTVDHSFRLSAETALPVAEICKQLEGLPLAIELAAARVKVLPPRALLPRLEHRLSVLTGGPRDAPMRQRTLRATIAWSYDLLSPDVQTLFRRLSVFAGGWTLDAAAAVCSEINVLDGMASLIDNSLVSAAQTNSSEPRFTMLASVRAFGIEQLETTGEAAEIRRRHAAHFMAVAETAVPHIETPDQAVWLDQLEAEQANLRAALQWAVSNGEAERGLRLGGTLWLFWFVRNRLTEGRRWLEELLSLAGGQADPTARAKALIGAAALARYQGDYATARSLAADALTLRRETGDLQGAADALDTLGYVALYEGDFNASVALYEEALAMHRALGNPQGIADSTSHLGLLAFYRREYARAFRLHSESLLQWRTVGDDFGVAWALSNVGLVSVMRGDFEQAHATLHESLDINEKLRSAWGIACALEGLAVLASRRRRPARAVRLAAAAAALRTRTGTPLPTAGQAKLERLLRGPRRQLGADSARAEWACGHALSLDEAVQFARCEEAAAEPASSAPEPRFSLLSARENEVALLLARGLTNREIADALTIGERTVDTHVEHIRNKLGVRTRLQITFIGESLTSPSPTP